jgi:ribosomal protein S18 acetylase RimI-like enzyme
MNRNGLFTSAAVKSRMTGIMDIQIRPMTIEDYDKVYELWCSIRGFGIRSIDDSREGTAVFLRRNPTTSIVAVRGDEIVGAILCGHDGRTGNFYHVCVREDCRKQGIGKRMAVAAMHALKEERVNRVSLIAFRSNEIGNRFWKGVGWKLRDDINCYEFILNEENITSFNQ